MYSRPRKKLLIKLYLYIYERREAIVFYETARKSFKIGLVMGWEQKWNSSKSSEEALDRRW